ncbi:MAG: cytochrome P460 family protein [Deltaproteobacteria bacterium]|nr:cytochrome P460 family protein [Deltaproteobacteria bacterium]MBW2308248.1 cytochrome P460 family protein [Deltaproteobacteria bacterium]
MKLRLITVIALMSVFVFAPLLDAGENMPPTDPEKFWTYITETNSYKGWGFWPGHVGIYPGKSPHGAYLKLYANSIALKAAREGKSTMPEGAILVKENYGKDKKTLMAVTPMYRVKGYNPEAGDWFWAKYGPDGKVMAAGKPKGCVNCHKAVKSNDWIFTEAK